MLRSTAAALAIALLVQDSATSDSEKSKLHDELAASALDTGEQLIKLKAWDEARAFLELVRAKSDARAEALDKLIAKTDKQTSGLRWDAKSSDLVKAFGSERAKKFFAFAKAWKEKDAEAARWTQAEGEILDDLLDYVKAYARLTQIRAHYELPKTRFDWKLSVPAVWHARYKLLNPSDAREIEGKAGFTREGQATATNSVSSARESISDLVESIGQAPFYRNYLLNPRLIATGLGQVKGARLASVVDVETGLSEQKTGLTSLAVPKRNASSVPVTGYDDYTPIFGGKTMRQLGYPISLIFFDPTIRPKDVTGRLSLNMKDVEVYVSTPESPFGASITPSHKNTILLVPKTPLQPNAEYKVTIRYREKGEEQVVEWTFRTSH